MIDLKDNMDMVKTTDAGGKQVVIGKEYKLQTVKKERHSGWD